MKTLRWDGLLLERVRKFRHHLPGPLAAALLIVSAQPMCAQATAESPNNPATEPAKERESFGIQIGVYSSEWAAVNEWRRFQLLFPNLLSGLTITLVPIDLGDAKTVYRLYRLQAGPVQEQRARTICAALDQQQEECQSVDLEAQQLPGSAVETPSAPGPQEEAAPVGPAAARSQEELRQEAAEARRALEVFLRDEAVLFRKGEFELELSFVYSSETAENVRVGDRAIPKTTNRSFDSTMVGRYGITDKLAFDLGVPFLVYAEQETNSAPVAVGRSRTDDQGLGDVRTGLRYQLWRERGTRPALALALDAKSDTGDGLLGSGHWNLGVGFTLVKTVDPVVFFGGIDYTATLEQGNTDPGDEVSVQFGTGFSLNDRVSFNLQALGQGVGRTKIDGDELGGSALEIVSLQFGATVLVGTKLFAEPFVGVGLTDDAQDVVLGINFPYRF
jgi:hypothetical protein